MQISAHQCMTVLQMLRVNLIRVSLCLMTGISVGQELFTRNYTVEDGLPSNQLYTIYRDVNENLWFASDAGAVRYDGYNFETPYDKQTPGFEYDFVNRFQEQDSLFIVNGISYFSLINKQKGKIRTWNVQELITRNDELGEYEGSLVLNTLEYDPENKKFYIGTNRGALTLDIVTNMCDRITKAEIEQVKGPLVSIDAQQNEHFMTVLYEGKQFTKAKDDLDALTGFSFFSYNYKWEGKTWFTFAYYLMEVDQDSLRIVHTFPYHISSFHVDHQGEVWIGAPYHGLYHYDNIRCENEQVLLKGKRATCVIQDHENGYWVSTLNHGIFYIPSLKVKNIPVDNDCVEMIRKGDSLVVATSTSKVFTYDLKENSLTKTRDFNAEFRDMFKDRSGHMMISFKVEGIRKNGTYEVYDSTFQHVFAPRKTVQTDDSTYFLASGRLSVMRYSQHKKIKGRKQIDFDTRELLLEDDTIWGAGVDGLIKINIRDFSFEIPEIPELKYGVNKLGSYKNFLFLLSNKYGIIIVDRDKKEERRILESGGERILSDQLFNQLWVENDTILWVSTNRGIYRVERWNESSGQRIQHYSVEDGLLSNQVFDMIPLGHELYCLTAKGISIINRNNLQNWQDPILYLDSIWINGKRVAHTALGNLSYDQNLLKIQFHGISYKSEGNLMYHYRISETDTAWTSTSDRFVILSSLSPGNYMAEIKASDSEMRFFSPVVSIQFSIHKPFWQTWWFILVVIVAILGVAFLMFTFRLRALNRRQKLTDELHLVKQQALSSQMNPHFIFNSLNSIQRFILENDRKISNKYLTKFSRLMRLVLDNSMKRLISLEEEVAALEIYLELEALRFKDKLQFEIELNGAKGNKFQIPPLLLQPYVENAIWHGIMNKESNGKIKVTFLPQKEYYECIVEDDGVGRTKASELKSDNRNQYKSKGMNITNKRMELANQLFKRNITSSVIDLYDEKGTPSGTKVIIRIPYFTKE